MKPWNLAVLAYAGFYAIIAYAIHADNIRIGYPTPFILYSAGAQCLITLGIVFVALERESGVAKIWKWLFPLLVIDLCVGVAMDAMVPTDFSLSTHGFAWVANLLLNLWLVAPAYYFNFKIAYNS